MNCFFSVVSGFPHNVCEYVQFNSTSNCLEGSVLVHTVLSLEACSYQEDSNCIYEDVNHNFYF